MERWRLGGCAVALFLGLDDTIAPPSGFLLETHTFRNSVDSGRKRKRLEIAPKITCETAESALQKVINCPAKGKFAVAAKLVKY